MSSQADSSEAKNIAEYIDMLKDQILARWREGVRRDPEHAALIRKLDDQELQDHLPALADEVIKFLRGTPAEDLDEDAARHGRQRRALGYSVVPMVRELQIFRRVLTDMVHEIVGVNAEQVERARNLIIDIVDRSTNISILQYTLAAEEERNSAQGEARELHEQRDHFLVTLSHELRNQISPILLGVRLLKDLQSSDQRMQRAVAGIERQAQHQAILINDLLDISRFRYGKLQLEREKLDLRVPIRHALETFQRDFSAKQLKLEVGLPERPLFACADEARIAQVLINLISNAIKFTASGGIVRVSLGKQAGVAVVTVLDTGAGIDPEILPELFTMFFQANEPSKAVNAGLGVGLALAKVLTEMHGGMIEAYSEGKGKGAQFMVRLPIIADAAEEKSTSANRVLVVDDNPDHLELLADLLKLRGYEVLQARDASEALRLVLEHKPHACVIDIRLPGMDGFELARKLREIPEARDSRLVAVTGFGTASDKEVFAAAGFDHYFSKPPNIDELNRVLTKH
ncbi:MAG: response regulator [Acidobacteria bacterium]|nr:response regulator [Acidobacteriota bacterium]